MSSNQRWQSTKRVELGSCAFRQWRADHSHCQYIHGYQLKAKLWFGGNSLDDKQWLVDFGGLKDLKDKLKHVFDHTYTVAADDPELNTFYELEKKNLIQLRVFDNVGVERCAEIVYNLANEFIDKQTAGRCWVNKVEVFEHDDNSATYEKITSKLIDWGKYPDQRSEEVQDKLSTEKLTKSPQSVPKPTRNPAQVGNKVTSGKSNWFGGTTWE
tara:strand:- start:388 stop:1026 length:639 start_codon:yes stop_codon:yes gene_type:complete